MTSQGSSDPMIASLPMYPVARASVFAFWRAIASRLRAHGVTGVPASLDWPDDLPRHWRHPDLLLSQTCGYPLVTRLKDDVRVVGAFAYSAEGCSGVRYRSVVIARADDPARNVAEFGSRRVAFNSPDSQSGYNSFRTLIAPLSRTGPFFSEVVATGSHAASMRAVANDIADIAAIDCVSYAQICAAEPDLCRSLKVVGMTASAPGLPLITRGAATDDEIATLRAVLVEVARDPALADVRADLMIAGFEPLEPGAYAEILAMENTAIAAGYPSLA